MENNAIGPTLRHPTVDGRHDVSHLDLPLCHRGIKWINGLQIGTLIDIASASAVSVRHPVNSDLDLNQRCDIKSTRTGASISALFIR